MNWRWAGFALPGSSLLINKKHPNSLNVLIICCHQLVVQAQRSHEGKLITREAKQRLCLQGLSAQHASLPSKSGL